MKTTERRKQIAILGSTGSIGSQTLDVIRAHEDLFQARVLTAGSNAELLIEQARAFKPAQVVIADESKLAQVREALEGEDILVWGGAQALSDVVTASEVDMVVSSLVGFAGLKPTIDAIRARKPIALANKETLVVAGELITRLAMENRVPILPIDSEHSAIFQSLIGEDPDTIEEIILTASGGPFRKYTAEALRTVTAAQALHHPNWEMGAKITIDSATMMNKGFEVIEAKWLFGVEPDRIRVVVHPQSILHSAVQFKDGAVKGQLGQPDMRIPIQLALSYPQRLASPFPRLDWWQMKDLTFHRPDAEKFRCLGLAYEALHRGGNAPCVLNAANEVVNMAFRQGRCTFPDMPRVIGAAMDAIPFQSQPTLDDYMRTDHEARLVAKELLTK